MHEGLSVNAEYVTLIGIFIQTGLYLLGGYALVIRNDSSNKHLREEVTNIQKEIKGLAAVVTQMAVQEERLNNISGRMNMIDKRMDDLVHSEGWLKGRRVVDGEYP